MSAELSAQEEQPGIWYINGLGEGHVEGLEDAKLIVRKIKEETGLPVQLLYNESESRWLDRGEAAVMIFNRDGFYKSDGSHNINPYYRYNSTSLSRNLKDMLNVLGLSNTGYSPKNSIIVGHSQGALIANRLGVKIGSVGGGEFTKIYSVASPDDFYVHDGDNSRRNSYINLKEDTVLNGTLSLVGGMVSPNFTNYSKSDQDVIKEMLENDEEFGDIIEKLKILNKKYMKPSYSSGHGFLENYFYDGTKSKTEITQQLKKKFVDFGGELEVERRENLWLEDIELEGYGSNVPQMKKIKFDSRVHYSSNVKPSSLKVKICYALSKNKVWDNNFVRGPLYSTKKFTTKESSQKISNVFFYIPKTIPLGDYYLLEKVDCENKIKETDEIENQVKYKKIKIVSQEKEDIRTTDIKISGTGSGKIVIKNTMVYDGSNPDIGWVYQAWFFSTQPKFSTAKQIAITKARMGWGKNDRKPKQLTADISKLPVGTFYIWVIIKKLDNSHDDDTSNNYFRVSFTTQPKSS